MLLHFVVISDQTGLTGEVVPVQINEEELVAVALPMMAPPDCETTVQDSSWALDLFLLVLPTTVATNFGGAATKKREQPARLLSRSWSSFWTSELAAVELAAAPTELDAGATRVGGSTSSSELKNDKKISSKIRMLKSLATTVAR